MPKVNPQDRQAGVHVLPFAAPFVEYMDCERMAQVMKAGAFASATVGNPGCEEIVPEISI